MVYKFVSASKRRSICTKQQHNLETDDSPSLPGLDWLHPTQPLWRFKSKESKKKKKNSDRLQFTVLKADLGVGTLWSSNKFDWDAKSDYGFVKIDTKLSYHDGEGLLGVGFWRGTTLRLGWLNSRLLGEPDGTRIYLIHIIHHSFIHSFIPSVQWNHRRHRAAAVPT